MKPINMSAPSEGFRKTSELRKVFLESYGVEMDFPGYYYSDSKFVPNEEKYIIVLAWHIIP